jgi:hypothetical protein
VAFTSLTVSYWFSERAVEAVPLLKRADAFPHLQKLGFGSVSSEAARELIEWLPKAPVVARLKQLSIDLWQAEVTPWLPALKPTRLPEFQVDSRLGWKFVFTRDGAGAFSRLRCLWPRSRKKDLKSELFALLDELPASALTDFSSKRTRWRSRPSVGD